MTGPSVPTIRRKLRAAVRDAKNDGITLVTRGPVKHTHPATGETCVSILGAVVGESPATGLAAFALAQERLEIGDAKYQGSIAESLEDGFDGYPVTNKWNKLGREFRAAAVGYGDWQFEQQPARKKSRKARRHK